VREPLRIGLCGSFVVSRHGQRIDEQLSGRQGRAVFAYLVLNRSRSVSRDELVAVLWPDRPPRAPEAALSTILARLRRVLGHSILPADTQVTLQLPPDSWIDVEAAEDTVTRAEASLAEGSPERAIELAHAGLELVSAPLLPDVQHGWAQQRRTEVEELGSRLLAVIVRGGLLLGGTALEGAGRAASRLLDREPFRESGYAMLMEVHAARGDVAEALLVYERLRTMLRDELGISPSARVVSLYERLLRDGASAAASAGRRASGPADPDRPMALPHSLARTAEKRLVGRGRELRALIDNWAALEDGEDRVIAVAGEPGIGKTMLASAFAREVHRDGGIVLCGQAVEEGIVVYAPIVEALRQYVAHTPAAQLEPALGVHLRELAWLVPELAHYGDRQLPTGDPRLERMRLHQAVAALVAHAASERPVLLVLEDMQWADTETVLLLRQLLRETSRQPIVALLTYRNGEVGTDHPVARLLDALRRDRGVTRIVLQGLSDQGVAELVGDGEQLAPDFLEQLRTHTSGNPFFVEEITRSLHELRAGTELSIRDLRVLPDGVREVIQDRLRRLERPARDALGAAAVLGQSFALELLAQVVDADVLDALDAAVDAGLVVVDGEGDEVYRFRHALAREAIYHSLGRIRRSHLHLQAARALERQRPRDVKAAEIAHHLFESRRPEVAEQAIAYSSQAARRALAMHAYDDATQHYQRALDVVERHRPSDTASRCQVLLKLGEVRWRASGPSARTIFEQAAVLARGHGQEEKFAEAMLGLGGRFYAPTTSDEPYIELLEQTLPGIRANDQLHTRVLGRLAEQLMLVDPGRAERLGEQAIAIARRAGGHDLLLGALLSQHGALLHVEHLDERRRLAESAVELARRLGATDGEALAHHWLLYDLLELGDVDAAARAHSRLAQLADQLRQPLYRHSALVWQRALEVLHGRFDRADQLAHEALCLAEGAQDEAAQVHFVAQRLALVDHLGGAEKLLPAVTERACAGDLLWRVAARLLGSVDGRPSADTDELAPSQLQDLPRNVFWLTKLSWLAEVSARTGDHERAAVLYDLLAPYGDRFVQLTFDGSFGSVHRYLGLLAGQLGRSRQAADHFDEAVRRHAALRAPALHARTLCDYAEALVTGRAAGPPALATGMIDDATRLARGCGAISVLGRLQRASAGAAAGPGTGTGYPLLLR
jgi:DNA-binding SARP family transcriptional activator